MILGMSTSGFTLLHVVLSLIGIGIGLVVLGGMFASRRLDAWTAAFLATTALTSVTGFFFPRSQILPSHIVGALSLVALAVAALACHRYRLEASWRWIYVVCAVLALYFNVFVLIVQAFQKAAFLNALAPTHSDPPFVIAQVIALIGFVAAGFGAFRKFHPVF